MEQCRPQFKICFLGGMRYSRPLESTSAKKFRVLQALGEIFVLGCSYDLWPRRFIEYAHFYLLPKLPLPVLRYAELLTLELCLAWWLVVRHGVQILVAQSPYEGFAAAMAKQLARWCGYQVALVIESHGDFEASLFIHRRILLPRLYHFLMRWTARFVLRRADVLRAVSSSTRQQLAQYASGTPLVQFPTWTDIDVFLHAEPSAEARTAGSVLYAGVLIPRKGVHHLLNAFARISAEAPQARLRIVGREENPAYAAELKVQAQRLGIDERVEFLGEVSQGELAQLMQQAAVFALPTYSEGLPRVVFEAMAVGLPVVASAVSGIPDIIQDGLSGFLLGPGDEEMLAQRLLWLLEHPHVAQEMGHCARAVAERVFSTAVYVQGYEQVFAAAQTALRARGEHADAPF